LEAHSPRVVVSDWVMPNLDGVELCRRIRARGDACPTHFIMLTAHSDKAQLLDAYEAGVDDFVSKPFEPEAFLARVRAGIRAAKLRDDLIRKANGSQSLNAQLAAMNSRLERLAITDELTGLSNRRHGMSRLAEQWDLVERYTRPLTIAMIDIDHFKKINDTHGHDAGDAILNRLASVLTKHTRGTDTLCRVGGDEFLVIFPSQTIEEAIVCAERCLSEFNSGSLNFAGHIIKTTISIGLATRTRAMAQLPDILKAADQALYAAKHAGRHIVCVADRIEEKPNMNAPQQSSIPIPIIPTAPARGPIDPAAVLKRCGGDTKFAAAITSRFRAQAANEVGKIEQALAANDAETVARIAHSTKSMAAYMAADTAVELAKQIEALGRAGNLAEVAPMLKSLRAEIERAVAWIAANESAVVAQCA
jgi:diguanylate cyclase (GGDEF)-like protein